MNIVILCNKYCLHVQKMMSLNSDVLYLNVILSHLSEESIKNKGVNCFYQQRPLFNYISFCKHLNLNGIYGIFTNPTVKNEVINIFINENAKFTSL